jgi:phosphatidylethanolamine/phosphatidyl-N-methylethanolamine N-methyltransferase
MEVNTNWWNRVRYTFYTPVYNLVAKYFAGSRKRSIEALHIAPGKKVLLLGAGTGLDLNYIPKGAEILATDITPSMVRKLEEKGKQLQHNFTAKTMDAQNTDLPDQSIDYIILHLILAVMPDPVACIKECERVLKPGGTITVFDKFIKPGQKISGLRKLANYLTNFLFSDITRDITRIISGTGFQIVTDIPANLGGNFRILTLRKPQNAIEGKV